MASVIIHAAVCNELNKKLKRDTSKILIGTIAPDIAKLLGEDKKYTHFLDRESLHPDVPVIDKFLEKYKDNLNDDFVLGYYIHLYAESKRKTEFSQRRYRLLFPEELFSSA